MQFFVTYFKIILDLLKKIAYILTDAKNTSTHPINHFIKKYIKNGASYASARAMERGNAMIATISPDNISVPNCFIL